MKGDMGVGRFYGRIGAGAGPIDSFTHSMEVGLVWPLLCWGGALGRGTTSGRTE